MHSRRDFLKRAAMGIVGMELDLDKLLWIPGQKTFFLPTPVLTESQIIMSIWDPYSKKIRNLFEQDDLFYELLNKKDTEMVNNREMRIPFQITPLRAPTVEELWHTDKFVVFLNEQNRMKG